MQRGAQNLRRTVGGSRRLVGAKKPHKRLKTSGKAMFLTFPLGPFLKPIWGDAVFVFFWVGLLELQDWILYVCILSIKSMFFCTFFEESPSHAAWRSNCSAPSRCHLGVSRIKKRQKAFKNNGLGHSGGSLLGAPNRTMFLSFASLGFKMGFCIFVFYL